MFKNNLKTAWRNITRNKTYSFINISGLALGVAAFLLIALYITDELSYDRFNENADRIVRVVQHTRWNNNDLHQATTSAPFAPALLSTFPEIENGVRIDPEGGGIITWKDKIFRQEDIIFADKSLPGIFSYTFLYGNAESLSAPDAVIVNETMAKKIFGSAEEAYGQVVNFDQRFPATVTGVIKDIPENSHLRFSAVRAAPDGYFGDNWQNHGIYTYLLLKPGTDFSSLERKLPAFAANTIQKIMNVKDYRMELQPLTSIHLHSNLSFELSVNGNITRVYVFMIIAALILIIAIINYSNLTTARSSVRVKEIGVRKAIGSGKGHIAGLFVTEAVMLTLIATLIALLIADVSLPYFNRLTGKALTLAQFGNVKTALALLAFAILTGMISGIYPSFFVAHFKTVSALKNQTGNIPGSVMFRKSLVVFQFMVTIGMMAATFIIYRQLDFARNTDLGFNKDQVLTFHIDDRNVRNQVPVIKSQLLQNPAIEGAAAAGNPIGNNNLGGTGYWFETPDGNFDSGSTASQELMADADFLPTMDIQLVEGRNFSTSISGDRYGAALINETLMRKLGWTSAVGKRLQFRTDEDTKPERTIVGVVKDFHTYSLQYAVEPLVMVMPPAPVTEDNLYVKIAKGKTAEGLAHIKNVYSQFDKANQASFDFLDQNFARQYRAEEKQGVIAIIFSVLAICIAGLGLFGMATLTTAQRTKEIGIRKVLGASVSGIVALLSGEFVKLVLVALFITSPVTWWAMNKWLAYFAYRIDIQSWMFAVAGLAAVVIALLTVSWQAIRAAVADPVESLRNE